MATEKNGKNVEVYTVPTTESIPKQKDEKGKFWQIDKEMLRFKVHYFLFAGAFGACLPYQTIFAQKRVGISASALAAILTIQRCVCIFAKPSIGYISDYFNKLKFIICILSAVATISLLLLLAVPKMDNGSDNTDIQHIVDQPEASIICEFYHSNNLESTEVMYFKKIKDDNVCFNSLENMSEFLNHCSGNEKNHENESNKTEHIKVSMQKLNSISFPNDSFFRAVCSNLTEKRQSRTTEANKCPSPNDSVLVELCNNLPGKGQNCTYIMCSFPNGSFLVEVCSNLTGKFQRINCKDIKCSSPKDSFLFEVCYNLTEKYQSMSCEIKKCSANKISTQETSESDFQKYQFWLYAFISTISTAFSNSLFTLTDTACCESVQKRGAHFGRQNLWGSIGWGLMCPISGLLNDYTGDFVASWLLMAVMSFVSLLNMTKLEIINPNFSKNLLKDVGTVLSSKEFLAFNFCVIMNGVGTGIMWFYFVLFLTDIGGSRFLVGMVSFVQCFFGEIPLLFFSGWIIKKIGHFNVLTLALTAYAVRFFYYSQLQNPWLALPVEVLQGFSEGVFYSNIASFATLSAKPGTEATTQAVLVTAHEGFGIGIGCIIAGLGFDTIGGHRTFLYTSIYMCGAVALSVILHLLVRKQKRSMNVTTAMNA